MLNLKHLYYYHIYAQELSTTKAAKRLGITPPALSNQLKELEGFLGYKLTQRTDGKVGFTNTGELVQHYADRMFAVYEELKNRLSDNQTSECKSFRVGIGENLGARFAFDLLSLIVRSNLALSNKTLITFGPANDLLEAFKKEELDLILGSFAPLSPKEAWVTQKLSFPVRLFAPRNLLDGDGPQHQLAIQSNLSKIVELANNKGISFVLPKPTSVLREETDRFLLNSSKLPDRTIECNSGCAFVQLIERGFAMGFAPTPCLLDFKSGDGLTILGPPAGYWTHDLSVIIQKGELMTKVSPLAEIFSPDATFS